MITPLWSKYPDWVRWITADRQGIVVWQEKPVFDPMFEKYMKANGRYEVISSGPFRDEICERPVAEQQEVTP